MVRHTCDNPPCCNPAHLLTGTAKDNARDAVERGRYATGLRHPRGKLSDDDVHEIRRMCAAGHRQVDIARMFGVRASYISMLASDKYGLRRTA